MSFATFEFSEDWLVGGIKMLRNIKQKTPNQISRWNFNKMPRQTRSSILFSKN